MPESNWDSHGQHALVSERLHPPAAGTREGSKAARVLGLLRRPDGASLKELMKATGGLAYSVHCGHTFVSSFVYDLPFGSGKRWLSSGLSSRILGGWQMNGIFTLMSGLPLTLTTSAASLNLPGAIQTVDEIAPVVRPKGIGTGAFWFSPASFASPAPLTFGNTGINIFDGPGFFDLDFSLFKNVAINERFRLQLRAEAFNSTNTPQYGNPGTSFTSSTFGKVTGYCGGNCGPRDLQLGVKLLF